MDDLQSRIREMLLAGHTQREIMDRLGEETNALLAEQEASKTHALSAFTLSSEEWAAFKAHCTDGGGVEKDADLAKQILQALHDDDQAAFWQLLPHLLKSRMKITGHVRRLPGGVQMTGAPAAQLAAMKQWRKG